MIEINKTTKRLLTASKLGITFDYANGHRWITFHEEGPDYPLIEELIRRKIIPETKVYGNIIDALNYIDYLLNLIGYKSLEQQFESFNDWGLDEEFVGGEITWEESGTELKESFVERTKFH